MRNARGDGVLDLARLDCFLLSQSLGPDQPEACPLLKSILEISIVIRKMILLD